jgi:toxin ParE1/3/4
VTRTCWFHPSAREELDAAGEWYDGRLPGLSFELFDAVEDAIALILERPDAWGPVTAVSGRALRRFVLRRFPFSLVYCVVEDGVQIIAVAHAKLRPGYWRLRLRRVP